MKTPIATSRTYTPHTAVETKDTGTTDPSRWDTMLNQLGAKYNVPPLFLKAVMLSESGGRPDAVGDQGHSVGLFQLHDHGYGAGMGDSRYDPQTNAERATKGLAEAWHAGEKAGFSGENAVRAAYNYSFNPGGGWGYQGDSVVKNYNQLLADQKLPPLA
jgi:soluble lytic murein transglycosylase-like protein